jgi:hypothetical protein
VRRIALLLLAGLLGVVGLMQVPREDTPPPEWGTVDATDPGSGAVASPTVWYCPWVEAGDVADTDVIVVSEPDVDVGLTLLNPVSNEQPSTLDLSIVGPGASAVSTGTVLRVGESPATVEISNGPAAAAVMQYSDGFISADRCVASVPKIWYLTGGSTKTGTTTRLRLFNPFADDAEVSITAWSEFALDLIPDFDAIDVAGRSWTTIDFEPFLPFRDELAFSVTTTRGLVIPVLVRSDERGEGMWPGTGPSETWDFPIVTAEGLEPYIAVKSTGDDGIIVSLDIVGQDGAISNAREITIDSSAPALIPLSDLAAAPFGVRVRATAPIAATAIAVVAPEGAVGEFDDETPADDATTTTEATTDSTEAPAENVFVKGLAGTVWSPRAALEWVVPLDTLPDSVTTLWVMNTGTMDVNVSYAPLGDADYELGDGDDQPGSAVVVPAESIVPIPVEAAIGYYGYILTSDGPISVAWEIAGPRGVAIAAGIPAS